jgi:beta-galactosidase
MPPSPRAPQFPYGAVYFRKSYPPREDWARDYRTAAEDGMNTFRHWFLWSAIETAPGVYDWDDYDCQLDLAAENGIATIIAEMITAAPEWAFRRYEHARFVTRDGHRVHSHWGGSSATGGFPGLCLDNDDWKEVAERFLTALVNRYKHHPGLGGYDIWNECNHSTAYCYCPATMAKFRDWLRARYGGLRTLADAWYRHSFSDWDDIEPPREWQGNAECMDWLQFRIENAYRLMRWRARLIRELDPHHPVTAHGVALTLSDMPACCDEWRSAAEVDSWGFTWIAARRGDEPWKQWHAVDLVRAGSRGKPFWHAEAQAGPLWMQPQVVHRPRDDGRIATPEDIRLWNLLSFAGGTRGWLCPRWRPLLDGPLFGAFGMYGMDGARTARSEMTGRIARWANDPEQADLWRSRPVPGDIGIVVVPESQLFTFAQQGSTAFYADCARGAYVGFFENNIQADWVHIEHIHEYDALYLPFPTMLSERSAHALRDWVEAGGALISEGCPAYFGDRGRVGTRQPNLGLDELFGGRESYVEFTPDILGDLTFEADGRTVRGGIYRQAYEPTTGAAAGRYADGQVAVVDNAFGQGRTRLIGTFPGAGMLRHPTEDSRRFFAGLLAWAGKTAQVAVDDRRVTARLHDGEGGTYLWVVNPSRQAATVRVEVSQRWGPFRAAHLVWGDAEPHVEGRRIAQSVGARDATILRLH